LGRIEPSVKHVLVRENGNALRHVVRAPEKQRSRTIFWTGGGVTSARETLHLSVRRGLGLGCSENTGDVVERDRLGLDDLPRVAERPHSEMVRENFLLEVSVGRPRNVQSGSCLFVDQKIPGQGMHLRKPYPWPERRDGQQPQNKRERHAPSAPRG